MRALIVEQGWSRGALAATRALAAAGWYVGVAAPGGHGLAKASRSCSQRHGLAAIDAGVDAFVASVADVVRRAGYDVFGAGEAELLALSMARDVVPAVLPHAEHEVILRALDKASLTAAVHAVGMAVPDEIALRSVWTADGELDEDTPVVVKARLHANPGVAEAPPRIDTVMVTGQTAAARRVEQVQSLGAEAQVQRFHTGELVAYAAVRGPGDEGVVADSLQRASRIWPADAGASCRARTIVADPQLIDRCQALLAELRWSGLAELQFLVGADRVPRLIDLNGQFYGSLSLAVTAGANLPAIWAELALGRRPESAIRARAGVRYQWGTADLRRAVRERRGGLLADVAGTVGLAAFSHHSVASLRDPGPAAARLPKPRTQRSPLPPARCEESL